MNEYNYSKKTDLDEVLSLLKKWKSEAKNFRNDGWVQAGYAEKIKKVFSESGRALNDIKNNK